MANTGASTAADAPSFRARRSPASLWAATVSSFVLPKRPNHRRAPGGGPRRAMCSAKCNPAAPTAAASRQSPAISSAMPRRRHRTDRRFAKAARFGAPRGSEDEIFTPEALETLKDHAWPGNVRELKNVLQRALVFHEPRILEPQHIKIDVLAAGKGVEATQAATALVAPLEPRTEVQGEVTEAAAPCCVPVLTVPSAPRSTSTFAAEGTPPPALPGDFHLPTHGINLDDLEKSLLLQALDRSRNNQTRAAQLLGITRHTLRYRLEKHGVAEAGPN